MTLKTRKVRVGLNSPNAQLPPGVVVQAELSSFDYDGSLVVPTLVRGSTDGTGSVLLNLWPNERGSRSTTYRVTAKKVGATLIDVSVVVPDGNADTEITLQSLIE